MVRQVSIESERLADAMEALERYGTCDADVTQIVELLGDLVDDRNHGRDRDCAKVKAAILALVRDHL